VQDVLTDGFFLDRGHELADDLERDVRLEQRDPHFAQGQLDIFFAQPAFAAEPVEHRLEFFGERFEHTGGS
jgi:hypothetical protein